MLERHHSAIRLQLAHYRLRHPVEDRGSAELRDVPGTWRLYALASLE